jgi:GTP-binding protein Era
MKAGFVAFIGWPNAGKSTILNSLIGEKVGIVSRKPQSTRKRVVGVLTIGESQLCFLDSPGRVKSDVGLNGFLADEFRSVIQDADALVAVLNLDAHSSAELLEIVDIAKNSGKPFCVAINKTDLDPGYKETRLREQLQDLTVPILSIQARKSEALKEKLLPVLIGMLPESPGLLFDKELYTTQSTKDLVAEVVREHCMEYLHQEIPYGLAVKILKYDEDSQPGLVRIAADIIVAKENHVQMVIGQKAAMLKRIGTSSRIDIEKILGKKVFLETFVKVKKDWMKSGALMKELGYQLPESGGRNA